MRIVALGLEVHFVCGVSLCWTKAYSIAEVFGGKDGIFQNKEQAHECSTYLERMGYTTIINEVELPPHNNGEPA